MSIIKKIIRKIAGGGGSITPEWLRNHGALIGEDVELIDFQCGWKDATCLQIGNHVTLTGVTCLTHDASLKRFLGNDCNKIGRIVIGNNVFIGKQTVILPNVKIGDNVIVGVGSIVTHDIPSNSVVVGNPAKVMCSIDQFVEKHKRNMEEHPERVYTGCKKRFEMSVEELRKFNDDINGKIVYYLD